MLVKSIWDLQLDLEYRPKILPPHQVNSKRDDRIVSILKVIQVSNWFTMGAFGLEFTTFPSWPNADTFG